MTKQKIIKLYNSTFDDSRWAWFLMPIAIINIILSYIEMKKQWQIFKDAINDNDKFTEALMTLSFKISGKFSLSAEYDIDVEMSDDEIYKTANSQIALIVQKFIEDEMLLGIIKVDIDKLPGPVIKSTIRPVSYNVLLLDLRNFVYNVIFTSALIGLIVLFTYIFK